MVEVIVIRINVYANVKRKVNIYSLCTSNKYTIYNCVWFQLPFCLFGKKKFRLFGRICLVAIHCKMYTLLRTCFPRWFMLTYLLSLLFPRQVIFVVFLETWWWAKERLKRTPSRSSTSIPNYLYMNVHDIFNLFLLIPYYFYTLVPFMYPICI